MIKQTFNIYGDNIIECERILDIILKGLTVKKVSFFGNPTNLGFRIESIELGISYFFFFPGFKRWEHDIINQLKLKGGILREAPDCIVTEVIGDFERIVFTLEFCSAISAGNQAWQRCGRAYSIAKAGVPYIYLSELGGFELNSDREKKATRYPNAAIPFSYISYNLFKDNFLLLVNALSPVTKDSDKEDFSSSISYDLLISFIRNMLIKKNKLKEQVANKITEYSLNFVKTLSSNSNRSISYDNKDWEILYNEIAKLDDSSEVLSKFRNLPYKKLRSKKVIVPSTMENVFVYVDKYGKGITYKNLPFCLIDESQIKHFNQFLCSNYSEIPNSIINWIKQQQSLVICFINGFKPRGDDSRPDRGLLAFLRMLVGDTVPILTFVYGPAVRETWPLLKNNPESLSQKNGLWQIILNLSNAVIADSRTIPNNKPIFYYNENYDYTDKRSETRMKKNTNLWPISLGENDVDSVIHTYFKYILNDYCFEAMCNPPGGDWSGISLMSSDMIYRWVSLPRVTGDNKKRPDHVIQFFNDDIILTIESKEKFSILLENIGPQLNKYCDDLFKYPPNACSKDNESWSDNVSSYRKSEYNYLSASAYIYTNDKTITDARDITQCDIQFIVSFNGLKKSSIIYVDFVTEESLILKKYIKEQLISEVNLEVRYFNN